MSLRKENQIKKSLERVCKDIVKNDFDEVGRSSISRSSG